MAWTTPGTAVAGDVLTAAFWNLNVRDDLVALYNAHAQYGYQTRTSDSFGTIFTATTFATSSNLFTNNITWTADGTSSYVLELFVPLVYTTGTAQSFQLHITNGSTTSYGFYYGENAANQGYGHYVKRLITPSAGSTSMNARLTKGGGTGSIILYTGTGASSSDYMPAFIRVTGGGVA
jgi:hypothetical protein